MTQEASVGDRAALLRAAFDRSFASPPTVETESTAQFLAIRVGADRYVLRLSDVGGLFADKPVTWTPSSAPELVGIAGFRGTILPVYDLGALLGYPRAASSRWLVVAAAAPVALSFEAFDGFLTVQDTQLRPEAHARRDHVTETVQSDVVRPVIHLPSVLGTITDRIGHPRQI